MTAFFRSFFLLLLILQTSCYREVAHEGFWEKKIDVREISREVYALTTRLAYEKRLRFEDSTTYYGDHIESIRLVLSTQQLIDIPEARELVVDIMEELLQRLNSNPIIMSNTFDPPLKVEQIELLIGFESYGGLYIDPFYIGCVRVVGGQVFFEDFEVRDLEKDWWHYRNEPYWMSLMFVQNAQEADKVYRATHQITPDKETLTDVFYKPVDASY